MINLSITNFLANLKDGLAMPNRYRVTIFPPRGIEAVEGVSSLVYTQNINKNFTSLNPANRMSLLALGAMLPSRNMELMEIRTYGIKQQLPFSISVNEPLIVSFLGTSYLAERKYFEIWQAAIANLKSNTMNFPNEYLGSMVIDVLKRDGTIAYTVTLTDVFPSVVPQLELSYSSNNTPMLIPVTFIFKTWDSNIATGE